MKVGLQRILKWVIYILSVVLVFTLTLEFVFPPLKGLTRSEYLCPWLGGKDSWLVGTKFNSQGFTGDLLGGRKVSGEIRILTLGGSAFFYRNMTQWLKRAFAQKGWDNVKVTGAALSAHTSRSSVLKYKYLLSKYAFDYVLIYHGVNDIWANRVRPENYRSDYSHLDPNYRDSGSVVLKLIYDNLIWERAPETDEYDHYPSVESFRQNITYLIKEVRARGGEVILMTFASYIPYNYSRELFNKNKLGYNLDYRILMQPVENWGTVEHVREGLWRHNQVIRELAARYNVPLIDRELFLQELVVGREGYWFNDFCHLSVPGTKKFVSHIVDYFERAGILAKNF